MTVPLPHDIIGSLPHPAEEVLLEDLEDAPLPGEIVGSLPDPRAVTVRHEIRHQHFTPDGAIYQCRCGWTSPLCADESSFQIAWLNHL